MQEQQRDTAGLTTRLIIAYVRRHLGEAGVAELVASADETRPLSELEDERVWSSYAQKIALFEAAEELTGDPWVARRIGESVLSEQLGSGVRVVIGALGSPQRVLRSVARANVKFSTSATMRALSAGPGQATVAYRLHDGHPPSRHDCRYTQGILTQVTVLFGLPPARLTHPHCQVEGASECVFELRWPRWRWWARRVQTRRRTDLATEALRDQVADLERTVADLIATDDLDEVLARIAARASAAVHGRSHLLVARVGGRTLVHADGLDTSVARAIAEELLATGTVGGGDDVQLVAPIASARRAYGWLAAFLPATAGFLPAEQEHLEAYGGLAAAALDVTTSLADVRRGGEVNAALLGLSRQLAQEMDEVAIAQRIAQAAPIVAGTQEASVLLWDAARGSMRTVAAVGFGAQTDEALAFEVPLDATPLLSSLRSEPTFLRLEPGDADRFVDAALAAFGQEAVAVAPIVVDGSLIGLLLAGDLPGPREPLDPAGQRAALTGLADQAAVALARSRLLSSAVYAATHDHLTGLASRGIFTDRLDRALADDRRSGRASALLFLDLDGFKLVNDTHGHAVGDALLCEVARRIEASVRETDSVARISGDEFTVLLRDVQEDKHAIRVARQLLAALSRRYDLGDVTCSLSASVGIAMAPDHGATPEDLLRAADEAMYRAKATRGTYCLAEHARV